MGNIVRAVENKSQKTIKHDDRAYNHTAHAPKFELPAHIDVIVAQMIVNFEISEWLPIYFVDVAMMFVRVRPGIPSEYAV